LRNNPYQWICPMMARDMPMMLRRRIGRRRNDQERCRQPAETDPSHPPGFKLDNAHTAPIEPLATSAIWDRRSSEAGCRLIETPAPLRR
jgi:hypothetical protein